MYSYDRRAGVKTAMSGSLWAGIAEVFHSFCMNLGHALVPTMPKGWRVTEVTPGAMNQIKSFLEFTHTNGDVISMGLSLGNDMQVVGYASLLAKGRGSGPKVKVDLAFDSFSSLGNVVSKLDRELKKLFTAEAMV